MSSTQKYIYMGLGLVTLGAALYLLSYDPEMVKFDPKKHTKEELRKIVHEMFIEGATLYCQKLNLMRQAKASGDFTKDTFQKFMTKQEQEIDEAENDILTEKGISKEILQKLLSLYQDDPEIKDKLAELEGIHETVFDQKDGKIIHIPCKDMPEGLDEDSYILVYRKQQQCIRYHIYQALQESGGPTTDAEKQKQQQDKFMEIMKRRPEFQTKSMELYGVKKQVQDNRTNELLMREVYLDFYSKSLQPDNKTGVAYSKRLQIEQKQHNQELEKMLKMNEAIPGLKTDPLDKKEDGISNEQKALLGYKMSDDTFVEQDGKDESVPGIANSLMEKMKQNKVDADKTEEEKKEQGDKDLVSFLNDTFKPAKADDKKDDQKTEDVSKEVVKDQVVLGSLEMKQEELKVEDAPKVEEPKKEDAKKEEKPQLVETKKEDAKKEEKPKVVETKKEDAKKEEKPKVVETKKEDAKKEEKPKVVEPKKEEPKKVDAPKVVEPKKEEPKKVDAKKEEGKGTQKEEPKTEIKK